MVYTTNNRTSELTEIRLVDISHYYGNVCALSNVSLSLHRGKPLIICGNNGAGKSTLIKILLGFIAPCSGVVLKPQNIKVGYLPEERGVYGDMTVLGNLKLFRQIAGGNTDDTMFWINRLKLSQYLNVKAKYLSKGNGQKLQLAICLQSNPDLVLLDEPFSGLDPINSKLLEEIILDISKEKFLVVSTHKTDMAERLAYDILFLNRSKVILQGNINEIKRSYNYKIIVMDWCKDIEEYLCKINCEYKIRGNEIFVGLQDGGLNVNTLINDLLCRFSDINSFCYRSPTLEEIYVESFKGA